MYRERSHGASNSAGSEPSTQGEVSKIERLEIRAVFKDREVRITQFEELASY